MPVNKDTVMLPVHRETREQLKKLAKKDAISMGVKALTMGQYLDRVANREKERLA